MADRRYRAGESIEDICRACKLDRMHTVIVADADGRPIRVSCGYCGSEHNYRGGPALVERRACGRGEPTGGPTAPVPAGGDRGEGGRRTAAAAAVSRETRFLSSANAKGPPLP